MSNKAVFLDRDGVLIRDVHNLVHEKEIQFFPDTFTALKLLNNSGFRLIVVSNQPVVARGLASIGDVERVNGKLNQIILENTGFKIDGFYFCPHHPNADMEQYRKECFCRKPKPGMLVEAQKEHGINLERSFMIGDRISDIAAGKLAGCTTVLVQTGMHREKPIESSVSYGDEQAHYTCAHIGIAARWIVGEMP